MSESATERELTEQTENEEQEESKVPRDSVSESTVAGTSRRGKAKRGPRKFAPMLYTTCFNKTEDLLFCGGAGKNEMRVFDWQTGNIVALIGNLPKSILCGAVS